MASAPGTSRGLNALRFCVIVLSTGGDMPDLRVMVVADDSLSRAGLAALLGSQPGLLVVGQASGSASESASGGAGLREAIDVYQPHVLLWDAGWNPGPLLQQLGEARGQGNLSGLPWVLLLPDASHSAEAWALGVRALLIRDAGPDRLAAALQGAATGLAVLDPALAAALIGSRTNVPASPAEALTPREVEVLRLMAEGLPNKAIARQLGISEHTVKFHVNAILGKLDVESRTEAVVRATRLGLILL
jgi:two-component system, NarL family, nitrate/nitrite response regulator NarL